MKFRNLFVYACALFMTLAAIGTSAISCNDASSIPKTPEQIKSDIDKDLNLGYVEERIIDSCEYIFYTKDLNSGSQVISFTHKGNCKNPKHIYNDSTRLIKR